MGTETSSGKLQACKKTFQVILTSLTMLRTFLYNIKHFQYERLGAVQLLAHKAQVFKKAKVK